ncbi:hypothetical protein AB0A95_33905 [Micromonospora sp. NPDC049230]|uniref:hypothetical protein n=1 Tax=Micromonospora sp. NPDC049230 TaxID=3155502 RepID=UPI00340A9D04
MSWASGVPGRRLVADWLAETLGTIQTHDQGEPMAMRLIDAREPADGPLAPAYVVVTDGPIEEVRPGDTVQVGMVPVGGGIVWEAGTVAEVDGDRGELVDPQAWDCEAYGPEGTKIGALCFVAGDEGKRVCRTVGECSDQVGSGRRQAFRRVNELAAAGRPDFEDLADAFPTPDHMLGGFEGRAPAEAPGQDEATR